MICSPEEGVGQGFPLAPLHAVQTGFRFASA